MNDEIMMSTTKKIYLFLKHLKFGIKTSKFFTKLIFKKLHHINKIKRFRCKQKTWTLKNAKIGIQI